MEREWQNLTPLSGWRNYGGSFDPAGYVRMPGSPYPYLRGMIVDGQTVPGTVVLVLPEEARPDRDYYLEGATGTEGEGMCRMRLYAGSGVLMLKGPAGNWLSLEGEMRPVPEEGSERAAPLMVEPPVVPPRLRPGWTELERTESRCTAVDCHGVVAEVTYVGPNPEDRITQFERVQCNRTPVCNREPAPNYGSPQLRDPIKIFRPLAPWQTNKSIPKPEGAADA